MSTKISENDLGENILAVDHVSSILENSILQLESRKEYDVPTTIQGAIDLLQSLSHASSLICVEEATGSDDVNEVITKNIDANTSKHESDNSLNSAQLLACTAISTTESLHELVQRVNKSRKKARKSSVHAWRALESVVNPVFEVNPLPIPDSDDEGASQTIELSRTLALLAMGLALSTNSPDESITRMITSAVIPRGDQKNHVQGQGKKYQKQEEGSKVMTSDGNNVSEESLGTQTTQHSMARAAVLGLLRLAVDTTAQSAQDSQSGQSKLNSSIDMQIVAKMESGFGVGAFGRTLNTEKEDTELPKAIADVVDCVFGGRISSSSDETKDDYGNGDNGELTSNKDAVPPTLSLVANIRPWNHVQVEKLVRIAAEMDLWYSAEILCDAAIDTMVSSKPSCSIQEGKHVMMATAFPHGAEPEALLTDSLAASFSRDSIANLAAGAIIDIALDYRLYRRADVFASKFYHYGGPERYAEARFLHACDTITKVVQRKQVQIVDKQIDRVDKMVAKVGKDLMLTPLTATNDNSGRRPFHGDDIPIETMGEHIREFSLRRLRASNMHSAAARLAKLWGMQYTQDPLQMKEELEKRKLTYLQWDDEGCPGYGSDAGGALPLPQLISEPADLLTQFSVLLESNAERTVGFDCEWHETINYVAVLQLSTVTDSLLLDIPALTATEEGCNGLTATVGKLFSRSTNVNHVIGFGCKDDIKRLRASPCITTAHWFPQTENMLYVKDLRTLIAEVSPPGGLKHFGLSRACETFLGKQLDKAEQCSDWMARPLLPEQLEYAALDAWACAAIHLKMSKGLK
eukprot:CAMPEP_0172323104 /NCGR_PEP_ID=MMETSP1058-20130122/47862_1 /TAXON_ID=83371 /ORGANISM="Detonula confervacea, Strain CCMP 353" /LENGTH=805 /DNA_ID=CAMNT_0013039021 /DNA_START=297 /DNA_END=2714 /DNA_ORIENTATION=-